MAVQKPEPERVSPTPLKPTGPPDFDDGNRVRILAIIDKFRELGVNGDTSLPQLVVVGDQSSGKSSILEGLTGLSFPVTTDLCTRFATQVVLRRAAASDAAVKISIIPGPSSNFDGKLRVRLLNFGHTMQAKDFGNLAFTELLDEAAECMGLPTSQTKNFEELDKRFSDAVLKIEISGPDHRRLSIIDVPGLFQDPTKYQTAEDRAIIRNMIEGYVSDKRAIVLSVMDAQDSDLASQEVFQVTRAADPDGIRTVGIITKSDPIQHGEEQGVLKIARNEVVRLNYGWFVVKNGIAKDIKNGVNMSQRHFSERQFFNTAPWNELRKDRLGINPLRGFLCQLLYDHVRKEFPGLVKEMRNLAIESQRSLEKLGTPRQASDDQRRFLTRVAINYQQDVTNVLKGIYSSKLKDRSPRRLRAHLRRLTDDFATQMRHGHLMPFQAVNGEVDPEYSSNGRSRDQTPVHSLIRKLYRESQGAELPGTFNPTLLETLFREVSRKWKDIAMEYIRDVSQTISSYHASALEEFISDADDDVRRKLNTRLEPHQRFADDRAVCELRNLLKDEQGGNLQTSDPSFAETLAQTRQERTLARLASMGPRDGDQFQVNLHSMLEQGRVSNEDQVVNDIHDILKAYYRVALRRFTDNVVVQTVGRHFLGERSPLKVFSPEFVSGLSELELADLAGESPATLAARFELSRRVERLHKALEIAKQAGI